MLATSFLYKGLLCVDPISRQSGGDLLARRPPRKSNRDKKKRVDTKKARQRYKMLNVHFLAHFKYDLNEILDRSEMDPARFDLFKANLITKASRNGIQDAREYVDSFIKEGFLDEKSGERLKKLLQRYSKIR